MFGCEEISSLVFDLGTFNHHIRYSGEDSPKCVYQPIIGVNSDKYYFNEYGLRYNKRGTKVYSCMNLDGTIKDIDMLGKILDNLLKESMTLDLTYHPVLFSKPSLHNKEK